jgi:hypothetical protein
VRKNYSVKALADLELSLKYPGTGNSKNRGEEATQITQVTEVEELSYNCRKKFIRKKKFERLAIREDEIRHREFRIDQFQHFGANFVHRDIEDFTDGAQLGELVRCRGQQHFVQLLSRIFHRFC